MKNIQRSVLLLFFLLNTIFVKAQYVSIPDVNFRNALKVLYPSIFNGDLMDTTLAATQKGVLDVGNKSIQSVEGIQYFKLTNTWWCDTNQITSLPKLSPNLTGLRCQNNKLTSLPSMPSSMVVLICDYNNLTNLPNLPTSITTLTCNSNQILSLPTTLPAALQTLYVSVNKLTLLPDLPANVVKLDCQRNKLTSLPATLPAGLKTLYCGYNSISSIPILPNTLLKLYADSNQLTSLPVLSSGLSELSCAQNKLTTITSLPNSLSALYCWGNQITSLPSTLPSNLVTMYVNLNQLTSIPPLPTVLVTLDVEDNLLTSLPTLPSKLVSLKCYNNQLTILPALPAGLLTLSCSGNPNLACLPILPSSLTSLDTKIFTGTKITCVPNKPSGVAAQLNNYPICELLSSGFCQPNYIKVSGTVYYDLNKNNVKDANESFASNVSITTNLPDFSAFTNQDGYYELYLASIGSYTITPIAPTNYTSSPTASYPYYGTMGTVNTLNFTIIPKNTTTTDFGVVFTPMASNAQLGVAFPVQAIVKNEGSVSATGSLAITLPTSFLLDSSSNRNYSNGVLAIPSLLPGESVVLTLFGHIATNEVVGKRIVFTAKVSSAGSETNTANNTSTFTKKINGSWASNNSVFVTIDTISPNQISAGTFLEYTIYFQNVGTATANKVRLEDSLSTLLDTKSLQFVSTSHVTNPTLHKGVYIINFPNIKLPDSTTNKAKSTGYFRFKIKALATPMPTLGTNIPNKSEIFFDYNVPKVAAPIKTLVFDFTASLESYFALKNNIQTAYPNPNSGEPLHLNLPQGSIYKISNMQGEAVMNGTVDSESINISSVPAGVYLLEAWKDGVHRQEKVVRQ